MATPAVFTGPNGQDAGASIRATIQALTTPTVGDQIYVGQVFRSRVRKRTFAGVDVNGAPFASYSTRGPYYFYPNRELGSTRGKSGTRSYSQAALRAARATAAKNRHAKTERRGERTPYGIKYASYAAAKAAHGLAGVNLFGMEQHTHMLDTILVTAGGAQLDQTTDALDFGSELASFEQNTPETMLTLGFYGPEAERARGHNEGTSTLPKREFFALNDQDLRLGEQAIAQRMMYRAQRGETGGASQAQAVAQMPTGPISLDDVPF